MAYVGKLQVDNNEMPIGSTLYGICSTGATEANKIVVLKDFDILADGITIHVRFSNGNTALNPTLNVNNTGSIPIANYGYNNATAFWAAGETISFTYANNSWNINSNGENEKIIENKTVNEIRANRLAFLPADQIIIERTTDGGTNWENAGITDEEKRKLFVGQHSGRIPFPMLNNSQSPQCGLRITFTAIKYNNGNNQYNNWTSSQAKSAERFTYLSGLYFFFTVPSNYIKAKVERSKGKSPSVWETAFDKSGFTMSGNSGYGYLSFPSDRFGCPKNNVGNFIEYYWNYRITLMVCGANGSSTIQATSGVPYLHEIQGYGDRVFAEVSPDNSLMAYDHLYKWDENQNATFPEQVTAKEFVGDGSKLTNVGAAITDNITGSGENGYLAEFNGANTITKGPRFGGNEAQFLNNKGEWATPTSPVTIAEDNGTNQLTLAANKKYKLTAGGGTYIFTTPPNTTYDAEKGITLSNGKFGHSNSITAKTTQGFYPIKIDEYGHVTGVGDAITPITSIANKAGSTITKEDLLTALGLSSAMHFLGVTTTNVGSTTASKNNDVKINNNTIMATNGDVVLYDKAEYVWGNGQWNLLGDESSYRLKEDRDVITVENISNATNTKEGKKLYIDEAENNIYYVKDGNYTMLGKTYIEPSRNDISVVTGWTPNEPTVATIENNTLYITTGSAASLTQDTTSVMTGIAITNGTEGTLSGVAQPLTDNQIASAWNGL